MAMELNARFETLFLLMVDQWGEEGKASVIKELDSLGIDGQDFYNRNCRVMEKYFATFQKHKVDSPGAKLLHSLDEQSIGVYIEIFWKHPDWFENIGEVPETEVSAEVETALRKVAEDADDIITALESLGFSSDAKWQFMVLKQMPKKQLEIAAAAVLENLSAFEKARDKLGGELAALLDNAGRIINDPNKAWLIQVSHKLASDAPIVPTLAFPIAVMVLDDVVFYGLLVDKVTNNSSEFTKEELVFGAKAFSEKSKLEILLALKETSLYSLEIAEKVGLTPATVSHHMSALISTRFVEVEKRDGKAYYRLAPKGIQRFLAGVGQLLL